MPPAKDTIHEGKSRQVGGSIGLARVKRFEHFIKVVADGRRYGGCIKMDGLLPYRKMDNRFPLWPAKEYAQLCALNEWEGFEPRAISLTDFHGTCSCPS